MIDFHTHVLPGVDHGSSSVKVSLSQLDLAAECGIKAIVSTSHFYPHQHSVKKFLEARGLAYDELVAQKAESHPEIILAAEVLLCEGMHKLPELESLGIGDSGYILLEIPMNNCSSEIVEAARKINANPNTKVILAHADRYPKENIEKMIKSGAKIQLNASGLCTLFKRKHLYKWIESDLVVALGSDVHGVDRTAYSKFIKAIERIPAFVEGIMIKSAECLTVNEYKKAE